MLRKSIIIAHKSINFIVAIVSLLLFLICLYAMIDAVMVYNGANDSEIMKYKPTAGNTEELRELSEDAVAWLTVDDTRIDYPVMQGKTNAEYLNKDPYGEFSLSGSIFLDNRNDKTFSDPYSCSTVTIWNTARCSAHSTSIRINHILRRTEQAY